jgi:hypothetical protein
MTITNKNGSRLIAVALVAAFAGLGAHVALASQPQMDSALKSLLAAQDTLRDVTLNKGGHADKARKLIADAINEVQAGIAYGKEHGL